VNVNWEAIGAVGEIVGATAVVVTLLYVAVQIRNGTRETQAMGVQAAASMDQEFLLTIGASPVLANLWATYLAAPETLPDHQKLQGVYLMASLLRRTENIRLQKRLGTLSEEGWESRQPMIDGIANSAGYAAFLKSPPAAYFTKEFRDYMAQLVPDE